uniref:Protein SON n=1 Tax=Angiostrongylus cantonensis TaxID=6313 RepID=A0A0K0DEE4_ANGCA
MDKAEQKNGTAAESAASSVLLGEPNGDYGMNKLATSDDIVKDLLNDVRQSEKPFSVEDLTAAKKAKEKKKSKEHKHKKSKKKKKHRSKRHRSSSRRRSRSRSQPRKKHRKRYFVRMNSFLQISDDDDLPVGADFRTVMKEAKLKINISSKIGSFDLAALPVVPPLGKPPSINAFPLSKPIKKDEDETIQPSCTKRESDILNKVIAEKGRGDFIPRNLKVKYVNSENSTNHAQGKCDGFKKTEPKLLDKSKDESFVEVSPDEDEKNVDFVLSAPPQRTFSPMALTSVAPPAPEPVSDGELEKEIAEELTAAAQPKYVSRTVASSPECQKSLNLLRPSYRRMV